MRRSHENSHETPLQTARNMGFTVAETQLGGLDAPQVLDYPGGRAGAKVITRIAARSNREHSGLNGSCAGNIERRVANDQDFSSRKRLAGEFGAATLRDHRQAIPVFVIVPKRA